jgi:hypothetical protein
LTAPGSEGLCGMNIRIGACAKAVGGDHECADAEFGHWRILLGDENMEKDYGEARVGASSVCFGRAARAITRAFTIMGDVTIA